MYKKILVPIDGSKLAECALEHTRVVVTGCQAPKIILLYVMEPLPEHSRTRGLGESDVSFATPGPIEDMHHYEKEKTESEAKDYLTKMADRLKKEGIAVEIDTARGDPAEEILNYAKMNEVDLIIMSTHGRSGVSRLAFGSVANTIVNHTLIPVLIAVPKGCRITTY